jgi:hypothetical protein
MFKRLRWLAAGAAVGFGASLWTQRKVKAVAARYHPSGLADKAIGKARSWPGEVLAALREGRATMHERETELRQDLQRRAGQQAPGAPDNGAGRKALPNQPLT